MLIALFIFIVFFLFRKNMIYIYSMSTDSAIETNKFIYGVIFALTLAAPIVSIFRAIFCGSIDFESLQALANRSAILTVISV